LIPKPSWKIFMALSQLLGFKNEIQYMAEEVFTDVASSISAFKGIGLR